MTTLVTGAFGCIGAWVCKRLLEAGERPVAFDVGDDPWRMRMLLGDKLLRDVVMVRGDIADREGVTRAVGEHKVTRIIHLAAWQVPLCRQDPSRGALINVVGTANVFEAAKAHRDRVGRVAYFSSAAVFGPPSVYGPGRDFGVTADPTLAMKAAVLGRPFQIRWGGATDLIYADDVARACIAASTTRSEERR